MHSYFFQSGTNTKLYCIGVAHSYDPKHPQFEEIRFFWREYLSETTGKNRIVIVEHESSYAYENGENGAIIKDGEVGLISLLAKSDGVKVVCLEPDRSLEFSFLDTTFTRDEIAYYYFARVVAQWHRIPTPRPRFEEYVESYLRRDQEVSKWNDFDFSLPAMMSIHKKLFKKQFDSTDADFFNKIHDPTLDGTVINKVARQLHEYRDKRVIEGVKKIWNEGTNIFMVYGRGHVDAFRKEFERLEK